MIDEHMQSLTDTMLERFPGGVLSVDLDQARSEVSVQVAASKILEIARFLHDDPGACFDHITDICSADYPADQERFEVIYLLLSLPFGKRIRLKARVRTMRKAIHYARTFRRKVVGGAVSSTLSPGLMNHRSTILKVRFRKRTRSRFFPNRPQPPHTNEKNSC